MDKPWICPKCGNPNRGDACSQCMAMAPVTSDVINDPISWFGVNHGYRGLGALPRSLGLCVFIIILIMLASEVWYSYQMGQYFR